MPNNNKSDWDKLWDNNLLVNIEGFPDFPFSMEGNWFLQVKSVGDKLQSENNELRKTEPEWVRYFEESMRQILEQKQKLESVRAYCVALSDSIHHQEAVSVADYILELLS